MYLLIASILALGLVHVGRAEYLDKAWAAYKKRHGKQYDGPEDKFRHSVWSKNVQRVQQHNLEFDIGMHSYTLGVNEYSDLTQEEYRKYLLGFRKPNVTKYTHTASYFRPPAGVKLPKRVDWRERGFVTPIKNQGRCGSCWAFSSTGALEGQHFNVTGYLVSLSEQQLVDCVTANAGCNGGWMDNAFQYIYKNKGIDVEYGYPYQAKDGPCRFDREYVAAEDFGYSNIRSGSESDLQAAVATVGPISVAIDANHESFMQYRSGVYDEPKCTQTTDHAVLVVGYGTTDGKDYWLVKNSWGTSWGMGGYIMMSRNKDNQCAIADYASYPIV